MNALLSLKKYFKREDARSAKALKNILGSFLVKGASIIINLALVPLTINYLSPVKYGVWLTISSMLGWINFFDVGLGQGLRNKLTESVAKGETERANSYVSTAYVSISVLCTALFGIFLVINHFLNWNSLLHIPVEIDENFKAIALIIFSMFSIQFVLQLINSIFFSTQQSYKVSMLNMISNLFTLIGIFILMKLTTESLYNIAIIFSVIPVLVYLTINIYYFKGPYKYLSPRISKFDRESLKDVLHLGIKFFVIQISGLIFFQTSNLLICRYFTPDLVTPYNVAFRYFSIVTMVFSIVMVPYWSAYTDAYVKKDFVWIRKTIRLSLKLWILFVTGSVVMLLVSGFAYQKWVGGDVKIDFNISFFMMLYVILTTFGGIFMVFLNGIGEIKLQMIINFIGMILFIPLSYVLAKVLDLGVVGIILSTIICNGYGFMVAPFEVKRFLHKQKMEENSNLLNIENK